LSTPDWGQIANSKEISQLRPWGYRGKKRVKIFTFWERLSV